MAFAEWTFSGIGAGTLDASVKYAGSSSYRSLMSGAQGTSALTHGEFSEPQAMVILWSRAAGLSTLNTIPKINISSYGDIALPLSTLGTWEKFKVVFWYDVGSNTKFGRVYKWGVTDWLQHGSDTNFGAGSPAAGSISLKHTTNRDNQAVWFDEVEVYS